ncbi:hypothetical protein BDQ12DRAFT_128754 [Crucibulum laeve]|uniref:Uncharacterized protein n=1 Tax=Crucibulum laeve TaxID=68775 RepID=A0A5C3LHX0_9AGAR|nr:hypothetical protein BDQ12DRAFT_128754 [Crucibulum laeve]
MTVHGCAQPNLRANCHCGTAASFVVPAVLVSTFTAYSVPEAVYTLEMPRESSKLGAARSTSSNTGEHLPGLPTPHANVSQHQH